MQSHSLTYIYDALKMLKYVEIAVKSNAFIQSYCVFCENKLNFMVTMIDDLFLIITLIHINV